MKRISTLNFGRLNLTRNKKMDFLKEIVKEIGDDYTQLASDIDDTETFVDTGSYIFNSLVSGSIFGGVSGNKITAIAGESSTGKTFFSLAVVKNFLDSNPDGYCLYFDTEAAVNKSLLASRGIDLERLVVVNVVTIEQFRQKALQAVDIYLKKPVEDRKPCMFVLDSLGMLSTEKEIRDALDDKQVRDMTKSQLVKGAFRMLTLKLGQANIPLLVTNHTYDVIGCALKGTKIKTPNGNIDISEIEVGDYVNTMVGPKKVINTYRYSFDEYYEVELENGSIYKLTGEHKLMTQEGEWKKVSELTEEDIIINIGN
jgi:RecA/RadA recombinase